MNVFPCFVPLWNARILVVGDGEPAAAKLRLVEDTPAEVVHVPAGRALDPQVYEGARLVFIALEDVETMWQAAGLARRAGAWVNTVDKQEFGDFHTPAIVDRSPLIAAIGTGGAAPVLATLMRGQLEQHWPKGLGTLATMSGQIQAAVREALPDLPARRAYWRRVLRGPAATAAYAGNLEEAQRIALAELAGVPKGPGRVWFLQAPHHRDLMSLVAVQALGAADRAVVEPGVPPEIGAFIRRDAPRTEAATDEQLAAWTGAGEIVVWISSDPQAGLRQGLVDRGVAAGRLPVAPADPADLP